MFQVPKNSDQDRRDALEVAARDSSYKAHLLEKDIWAVATRVALYDAPFAEHHFHEPPADREVHPTTGAV